MTDRRDQRDAAIRALVKGVAQATVEYVYKEIIRGDSDITRVHAERQLIAHEIVMATMANAEEDPDSEVHAVRARMEADE